jgi:VWFA-related protein
MRAAALLLLTATIAAAQFKGTATLVIAPTVVIDGKGNYVDGLEPRDLVLYDNGVAQPVQVDEAYAPVSLVVAIQTSSSAAAILDKLATSGILFSNLLAGDRGETAIVTFSDEVRVARDFTANSDLLKASLEKLHVQGDKAVTLDAIMQAFHMLGGRKQDHRKILLVVAEKRDRNSKTKFDTVLREAERQNVLVYWLSFSTFLEPFTAQPKTVKSKDPSIDGTALPPDTAPGNLLSIFTELAQQGKTNSALQLTRSTGGRAAPFVTKEALEQAIEAIAAEVHRQYIVSFTPRPGRPGVYHAIRVEVKGRPELTARTRAGYWSL